MRTAHALTVSGGDWCIPEEILGEKNWKKKKKNLKNIPLPKNWRPPRKIGDYPPGTRPPREQNHTRLWKYNLARTSLRAVTSELTRDETANPHSKRGFTDSPLLPNSPIQSTCWNVSFFWNRVGKGRGGNLWDFWKIAFKI